MCLAVRVSNFIFLCLYSGWSIGAFVQECMHNDSLPLSPAAQRRSAECHRGNKQQQLSRMGLIKHSASALQPEDYCSLDQSRPDWPRQRPRRCHDHRLPLLVNAREEDEEEELDITYSSSSLLYKAAICSDGLGSTQSAQQRGSGPEEMDRKLCFFIV